MRRTLIITIIVLSAIIVAGAAGIGIWVLSGKKIAPLPNSTQTTGQQQQQNINGGTQTTGTGSITVTAGPQADSVKEAFEANIAPYNTDNIQPKESVVVGEYAIQRWLGSNTGGEALLKYDSAKRSWAVISGGGGQWSAIGLIHQGVPTSTAEALLVKLGR